MGSKVLIAIVLALGGLLPIEGQGVSPMVEKETFQTLRDGWTLFPTHRVEATGADISRPGFDTSDWYPAKLPTTVAGALVNSGIYKDVFLGKNLELIPTTPFLHPWWFRKEFKLDKADASMPTRLLFDGLNYKADVWLNGVKIAGKDKVHGVWRTFDLDVTKHLRKGVNALAVLVHAPQPGEFTIGFVDWNPVSPDNNMGLYREVHLRRSGRVSIEAPYVTSKLDTKTLKEATLTVCAELVNHTGASVSGLLHGTLDQLTFQVPYTLKPHEKRELHLTPDQVPVLKIQNPRLWWPVNLGEPALTTLKLQATDGKIASDCRTLRFGIREVGDYFTPEGARGFTVNGIPVQIRGTAWVDDMFLREDTKNLEAQFQLLRHMNLNTVRLEGYWGASQRLYDLADEHGILLMPGFSCQWEWPEYLGKPQDFTEDSPIGGAFNAKDINLLASYIQDQVRWLRHHPSIFSWGLGSDKMPTPDAERRYLAVLKAADGTRPVLACAKHFTSEVSGRTGLKMTGPYDYVTPNYWYLDTQNGGAFGFNTETSAGPQVPPLSSVKRMIPSKHLWPINDMWDYHCARREFGTLERYLAAFNARYGDAKSVEEFTFKAQAINYEGARAMFEAFSVNRPKATGVIHWMGNSAWPKMIWQLYDYYLMPGGAFYGTRKAGEPCHVSYNYGTHAVDVVNDTREALSQAAVHVRMLDVDSKVCFDQKIPTSVPGGASRSLVQLPPLDARSPVYFVDLRLLGPDGKERTRNFYWLSPKPDVLDFEKTSWIAMENKSFADFTALNRLPKAAVKLTSAFRPDGGEVVLTNTSDKVAFFLELQLVGEHSGEPVLPASWDDNYVSLLPGEQRTIPVRFNATDLGQDQPKVTLQGWNLALP